MIAHQRWTQTNITDLRNGVAAGIEAREIADALGRPVEEVRIMASRLRLPIRG